LFLLKVCRANKLAGQQEEYQQHPTI